MNEGGRKRLSSGPGIVSARRCRRRNIASSDIGHPGARGFKGDCLTRGQGAGNGQEHSVHGNVGLGRGQGRGTELLPHNDSSRLFIRVFSGWRWGPDE